MMKNGEVERDIERMGIPNTYNTHNHAFTYTLTDRQTDRLKHLHTHRDTNTQTSSQKQTPSHTETPTHIY